jgi:DNA-binding transcriptional LysR family regulator
MYPHASILEGAVVDPTQLRVFLAVAENLHFGQAAERLHLAQPYLSRTVRALEDDVGAPLFTRTTRRVELTPAGRALIEPARAILGMHDEAREAVRAAHHGESGRVRLAFAGPSSHAMVGRLARAVRHRHPLIKLELQPGRYGATAVRDLVGNHTDLAMARFASPPAGVESRGIARETCVVVLPADHPRAGASEVSLADLRGESFVAFPEAYGSAVRRMLVEQCQAAGFAPTFVQESPDSWTSVALVAAGVGLHFTTDTAVAHMPLDGVRVVRVSEQTPPVFVYLLWRRDDHEPALAHVLSTAHELFPTAAPDGRT